MSHITGSNDRDRPRVLLKEIAVDAKLSLLEKNHYVVTMAVNIVRLNSRVNALASHSEVKSINLSNTTTAIL